MNRLSKYINLINVPDQFVWKMVTTVVYVCFVFPQKFCHASTAYWAHAPS